MVTAAALAHVNRLPVLLLPGDVFAGRRPDPVLQQVENFADPTVSANDCFRPVSRHFDRIVRPEQLLGALPRALQVLTDPAECGPAFIALPQDVQTMAYDYPTGFFAPRPDRRTAQHDAQAFLRVAHGNENAFPLRGQGEGLCGAHGRFADATLAGHEDKALLGEHRHRGRRSHA